MNEKRKERRKEIPKNLRIRKKHNDNEMILTIIILIRVRKSIYRERIIQFFIHIVHIPQSITHIVVSEHIIIKVIII